MSEQTEIDDTNRYYVICPKCNEQIGSFSSNNIYGSGASLEIKNHQCDYYQDKLSLKELILQLPGREGWINEYSKSDYMNVADELQRNGLTVKRIYEILLQTYIAARADN